MDDLKATLLQGRSERMPFYTDMAAVFRALQGREKQYDWLITGLQCDRGITDLPADGSPVLVNGEVLSRMVLEEAKPVQFIWGVFTGMPKGAGVDLIRMKMEPLAEGNETFWSGEPRIQYPGALVELVCWDSEGRGWTSSE